MQQEPVQPHSRLRRDPSPFVRRGGAARRQYGLGGEAGVIVMRNVRIAGGYNLLGFTDRDLSSFRTTRRGAYIEFGFKFDEGLFGLGASEVPAASRTGTR